MIVDLFAGPGGWDVGAGMIGLEAPIGLEIDRYACATRAAVGHPTIRTDVAAYPTEQFRRAVTGLIASPPCKAFSKAGKREGIEHAGELTRAVYARDWGARPDPDPLVWLVLEVGRWASALRPEWIACEQVVEVLPIWQAYRHVLEEEGYSAWAGIVTSEQYGVGQVRPRALLLAHRARTVGAPPPTHERYLARDRHKGDRLGFLLPFVTMAEALGWGMTARPYPVIASGRTTGGPDKEKVGGSGARQSVYDEWDAGRWLERRNDQGIEGGAPGGENPLWPLERPATVIAGRGLVTDPGANGNRYNGATKSRNDGYKIDVAEALTLQSFPADYPVQGTDTAQFRQIGDAVPPLLAAHALAAVTGREAPS